MVSLLRRNCLLISLSGCSFQDITQLTSFYVQSASASYRPSPLSFNSPRASPFRRPESPSSPSPLRHSTTPTTSPTKAATGTSSPSKLNHSNSPATDATETWTPRGLVATVPAHREPPTSPTRGANSPRPGSSSMMMTTASPRSNAGGDMNAVSKLQPAQVRELREAFQILDRDSDGVVGRDDVADMLTQLGKAPSNSIPSKSNILTAPFRPPLRPRLHLPLLPLLEPELTNSHTPHLPHSNQHPALRLVSAQRAAQRIRGFR
jgi:hypothetical protein